MSLKKMLLLVPFLLFCVMHTQAQTTERQDAVGKFRVIPSVILTYNPYSIEDAYGKSVTTKYNFQCGVGVEAEYRFFEIAGLALGVNYHMQGMKTSKYIGYIAPAVNKTDESEIKLKSICVPLLLCLHPLSNDRLTLKLGFQTDFLLNKGDHVKSNSFGVPLGIAYNFDDRIQFELRYNSGLTEILKNREDSSKKECFMLACGIVF